MNLDMAGICASGGSACTSGAQKGSHVIQAIHPDMKLIPIRFSFSKHNTKEEIDLVVQELKRHA
jgi:cysteine desulfurase